MAENKWEPDKTLHRYIYDYFVKRKLHESAKAFRAETKVSTEPVEIDAPGGFLDEWFGIFWDMHSARYNGKRSESIAVYLEAQQRKARENQQQIQMQQLQMMQQRNIHLQRRDPINPSLSGPLGAMNSEGMLGQPSASVFPMKLYEERIKIPQSMDYEASTGIIDVNKMTLLKSMANQQSQLPQGTTVGMSGAFQKMVCKNQQANDIRSEGNLSGAQRSLPMDPSSAYGQALIQSNFGLGVAGLNQGVANMPLNGWPLTGLDQLRPNSGGQLQGPNTVHNQTQFLLAQSQAHDSRGNSSNYVDTDPHKFGGLPRSGLSTKNRQSTRYDGSMCSPTQSSSPKMNTALVQKSTSQQQDHPQQHMHQNNNKRKHQSSSGPANSTGSGNTLGHSPSSPPSTRIPGDGSAKNPNHQPSNLPQNMMVYHQEGIPVLLSSYDHMEDINNLEDVGSLDDNVESYLISEGGEGRDGYDTIKQSSTELKTDTSKGFSFAEVGCIRTQNTKVTCCHFSSDGKLLASAGHDKKIVLWNMETLQTESTPEKHQSVITDIRFRPNSTQVATASYDKSVRLWDAANPSYCLPAYAAHSSPIMSLDFHPKKTDLFCFCDDHNEIRYWTTTPFSCTRVSKGATAQLRFQPRIGQYLAGASDKSVSIIDVETDRLMFTFQGHYTPVKSICWDSNGEYLASTSEDAVKIWSLVSGECIHEFGANGNRFHSCTFHPSYSTLMVVGGVSSMELWNIAHNKTKTVPAHENVIAALDQSPIAGIVASASYDGSVKLWK